MSWRAPGPLRREPDWSRTSARRRPRTATSSTTERGAPPLPHRPLTVVFESSCYVPSQSPATPAVGRGSGARRGWVSPTATPTAYLQGLASPVGLLLRRTKERQGLRLLAVEAPPAAAGGWRQQHLGSAMDGTVEVGEGVGVNDAPTAPQRLIHSPLGGSGRCLPCCFLLMGLRAEFRN
jgi:hypothetical protein